MTCANTSSGYFLNPFFYFRH